ncbi:hypothetical protein QBC38DRAFT_471980 [Podospora fimiseda]|uniref:DUF7892 domain-containing protein n=1 Tax=Podospora fimiseda TaxID=252190 RepID=A0AAN7H309_9PEZI|nr:hypothetical protein QBC38DRAFT_471980 [Podospora fimiseda]
MVSDSVGADGNSSGHTASSSLSCSSAPERAPTIAKVVSHQNPGDRSILSPQIWHHIFTFCPPKSLGNLLAVNKQFNCYLDPASTLDAEIPRAIPPKTDALVAYLKPNDIWRASRRLFWPNMPTPLRSKTELDMWRLACSKKCQFCNKTDSRDRSLPFDPRHPGPGSEGTAAIWAFGTRTCASCLVENSTKEVDLLISSNLPSAVASALPFVFLTGDFHALSVTALEMVQISADLQLTKYFSLAHVKVLETEFSAVKDMGSGTIAEWLKGLGGRGKDARQDASKWEKYESSGGTAKMCSQLYPGYINNSLPELLSSNFISLASTNQQLPHGRQERTMEEVAELKAARKAGIERRAMLLDPPLTPNVLRHILSFQAAIQIVNTLDDTAWEILKPRLIAQRAEAEQREKDITLANTQPQSHLETTLASTKQARDLIDKDWEDAQAPLRARIAGFADDIVREWRKGKKVTSENCAKFAVDALLYVHKQFYDAVAKDAAAAKAAGKAPIVDPPDGPFTQKLTLENMKWIFDSKIKPHTDGYRKELFYCNGCEGNYKTFGFEGAIQHYAAKHSSNLSLGSIIVYWRAEWPEIPPFSAEVRPVRPPPELYGHGAPPFGVNGAPPPINHVYPQVPPSVLPPAPNYGYGAPPYNDPYQLHPQPFVAQPLQPPPVHFRPQHHGFEQHAPYGAPHEAYYSPYQQPPGLTYPVPASQWLVPPRPQYGQIEYNSPAPYPPPVSGSFGRPLAPTLPNLNITKLEDVARNSREVWQMLGNIRDFSGSMRVFVTIHHLVKRFRTRFGETPPLAMFIDGLSNNKDMRPVRNVNGLVCKACHLGLGNAATVQEDRKGFSLPQLTNHFQYKHVEPMEQMGARPLDWVLDMVHFTDDAGISNLQSVINPAQRALIVDALPEAFQHPPRPMPASSHVTTIPHNPVASPTRTTGSENLGTSPGQSWQDSRRNHGYMGFETSKTKRGCRGKRKSRRAAEGDDERRVKREFRRDGSGLPAKQEQKEGAIVPPPLPAEETEEPDILDALESHLMSQRRSPPPHEAISSQSHRGETEVGKRSPFGPHPERVWRVRPGEAERRDDEGGHQGLPPGYAEHSISQRSGDARYDSREYGQSAPHHEEARTQSRQPVETFEIVHVIDGNESYYIRRPVRREPEVRYLYQESAAGYEDARGAATRSGVTTREGTARASVIPEAQPIDRHPDSLYVEEYDPRFGH